MAKFRPRHDPAQNRYGTIEPGHVEIAFDDGTRWEQTADRALGHPQHPMTREQVADKLRSTVPFARKPIAAGDVEGLIDAVWRLETLEDVSVLPTYTVHP
jgi:2-methylcitrate dehydratase PrpD